MTVREDWSHLRAFHSHRPRQRGRRMANNLRRTIPSVPLGCCTAGGGAADQEVFVGRFELVDTRCVRVAEAHRHDHFELFWLRGPGVHANDSRRFELPAERPSLVLVGPGQVHRWEQRAEIRGTVVSFTGAFFDGREPPPSTLADYGFAYQGGLPPVLPAEPELEAEVAPLVARCEREYAERAPRWAEAIRAALRLILASALRAHRREVPPPEAAGAGREIVRHLQELVEAKFRRQSSVAAYARELGVSAGHLNALVREASGETAGELIRARILLEARRLLIHTELTVAEISYHLGYEDPSYFAKAFRRANGRSPGAFRAAIREDYRTIRD